MPLVFRGENQRGPQCPNLKILHAFFSPTRAKDGDSAKEFYQKLRQAGYYPWMDKKVILPGQDWEQVMIQAINDAAFFLASLSTNSIDHRGYVINYLF
jgi:hypothetical protein